MTNYILSLLASIALALGIAAAIPAQRPTIDQLDAYRAELRPLLDAIRQVESGGDDNAKGDNGKALGAYQIWRVYWQDATDWATSIEGSYEEVRDRAYAERIMVAYWHRYARQAINEKNYETLARVHNGGPRGQSKKATLNYWNKVSKLMKGE